MLRHSAASCGRAAVLGVAALLTCASSAAPRLSGKVGTGFDFSSVEDLKAMQGLRWWYDWGTQPSRGAERYAQGKTIEYVPMQWSLWGIEDLNKTSSLKAASALLGFNEPNHRGQANLEPGQAAKLWTYMQEAADAHDLRLGSPSAAPCGFDCITPDPFEWWDAFFAACADCRVDFLAVHIYSCNGNAVQWFLEGCKKYGLPIWVTEFACPIGPGPHAISQEIFMTAAVDWMEAHSQVERFAWFAPRVGGGWVGESASLLQPDKSALTELGSQYLGPRGNSSSIDASAYDPSNGENLWTQFCRPCFDADRLEECTSQQLLSKADSSFCEHCISTCGFWPREGSKF